MYASFGLSSRGRPQVQLQTQLERCSHAQVSNRPVSQLRLYDPRSAPKIRSLRCSAEGQTGPGRQYETEFFRMFFGAPPAPKQDAAGGGGGDQPPSAGQVVEEEEEPDEEQLLQAKRQARQQAFFNFVTVCLFFGALAGLSTWEPHFRYFGRIWRVLPMGNKVQAYTELASEGCAWALLLTMGWPWNLLIYPVHLTRKELTNARKEHRGATLQNITSSVYNPFARRKRPLPSDQGAMSV